MSGSAVLFKERFESDYPLFQYGLRIPINIKPISVCGTEACPSTNGTDNCGEGYRGVLCAACEPNWAQVTDRSCKKCDANSHHYIAPFVVCCVICVLLVLYLFSTRPIRRDQHWYILPKLWQRFYNMMFVQRMCIALHRILSSIATQYLALMVTDDPYATKAFARPASALESIKVLVSFLQVCMHTWPLFSGSSHAHEWHRWSGR